MQQLKLLRQYWYVAAVISAYLLLGALMPRKIDSALSVTWHTVSTVALIIVSVFTLIGLVQVWLKEDTIVRILGEGSGIKAYFISALFGSLMLGPLFAIFPLLKSLLDRGARTSVIVAILTTWAVKLPFLPLEVKFLGPYFALLRISLILLLAIPISIIIEKLVAVPVAEPSAKVS